MEDLVNKSEIGNLKKILKKIDFFKYFYHILIRYINALDSNINKNEWTHEEDLKV